MRTLALATVLGAVCVALFAGGALALGGAVLGGTDHRSHVLGGDVSRIVVDAGSGDVAVRPRPAGRVIVEEKRRFWLRKPKLKLALSDGVLRVRVRCGSFGPNCSDDLRVTVPAGVGRTSVAADSGDVTVRGARGSVDVTADSGDIHVEDVAHAVHLAADSGDVTARGLRADEVSVTADSGDITVPGR